jgi:hypothetical protein
MLWFSNDLWSVFFKRNSRLTDSLARSFVGLIDLFVSPWQDRVCKILHTSYSSILQQYHSLFTNHATVGCTYPTYQVHYSNYGLAEESSDKRELRAKAGGKCQWMLDVDGSSRKIGLNKMSVCPVLYDWSARAALSEPSVSSRVANLSPENGMTAFDLFRPVFSRTVLKENQCR